MPAAIPQIVLLVCSIQSSKKLRKQKQLMNCVAKRIPLWEGNGLVGMRLCKILCTLLQVI